MKWIVLISILSSSMAMAAPKQFMGLNGGQGAAIWLDQRHVGGKEINILGFRDSRDRSTERALPKSEYQSLTTEMKNWMTSNDKRGIALARPTCSENVLYQENGTPKMVCFDLVQKADRAQFIRWYQKTVHLALGM